MILCFLIRYFERYFMIYILQQFVNICIVACCIRKYTSTSSSSYEYIIIYFQPFPYSQMFSLIPSFCHELHANKFIFLYTSARQIHGSRILVSKFCTFLVLMDKLPSEKASPVYTLYQFYQNAYFYTSLVCKKTLLI